MTIAAEQPGAHPDLAGLGAGVSGRGPWGLAASRLARNRIAVAALVLFVAIVAVSFAAPIYARDIAHTDPFTSHLDSSTVVSGKRVAVIQQGGGVLISSAVICCFIATILALMAGFFGGTIDSVVSRLMDVVWAFPVYLLAISLSTRLLTRGLSVGPISISPTSLWVPTLIIAAIYVPYVFRPVRGQVLSVREKEFIEASVAQGASTIRLMLSEILPNVITTVIVLLPLMIATNILTESALSYLSIGVQPPAASWGTIISDGQQLLYTRPWVSIAPGIMIVLTVLALNVFGDGIRDALDPRAKLRIGR
jgi:peptide/nickel transport system permease protein